MKKIKWYLLLGALIGMMSACGGSDEEEQLGVGVQEEVVDTQVIETGDDQEAEEGARETVVETEEATQVEEEPEEEVEEIDLTGLALNPLTGLYIDEEAALRRPIGVMINNHRRAQPQSGLSQADIVYETLVEGGIARLFAVYQDFDATKIGPVRSARHYYLDFSFDLDALYVHYGKSPQAYQAFQTLNPPHLDGLSALDSVMFFQDPERKRPHSTYTSFDGLMAGWDYKDYRVERDTSIGTKFYFTDDTSYLDEGVDANKVILDYSNYQYAWFEYDQESMTYLRFQFDGPQIDVEVDEQLAFDNIIVQFADMWVIPGDTEGRMDMDLCSTGTGYYIRGGKAVPITWEKEDHYTPTQYRDLSGQLLEMGTGRTWISVFPEDRQEKMTLE